MSWDDDLSSRRLAALDILKARFGLKTPEQQANDDVAAALAILQRARGREAPESPDDLVILSMPADWANMCDWASDPLMTFVSEAEAHRLISGDPPADDLPF